MRTTWLVAGLAICAAALPAWAQGATKPPPAPTAGASAPKAGAPAGAKAPARGLAATIAALEGADLEAAAKAAEALGASADPAAHEALLDALAFGLPRPVAVIALGALARRPAPSDVFAIVRYARHHNPTVRSAALDALASYPAPPARVAIAAGLSDPTGVVRAAAAAAAARGKVREAIGPLFELLSRGEESASRGLAAMADVEIARRIGDQLGRVPEPILAETLGLVLKRPDFGPDPARVDLVRVLAKIQDPAALGALTDYLDAAPKTPPRPSRDEAKKIVDARIGGGS